MLVAEEAVEIRVLSWQGKSVREIARMLEVSRNTVRRYLAVTDSSTSVRRGQATRYSAPYIAEPARPARRNDSGDGAAAQLRALITAVE